MKNIAKIILIALMVTLLAGCGVTEKWPRVTLERSAYRFDNIILPLRDGYVFAEQAFTIRDTESGYDIIIHAMREESNDADSDEK